MDRSPLTWYLGTQRLDDTAFRMLPLVAAVVAALVNAPLNEFLILSYLHMNDVNFTKTNHAPQFNPTTLSTSTNK